MSRRLIKNEAKQTEIMHILEIKDHKEPTIILLQQIKQDYIKLYILLEFYCLKNLVACVLFSRAKLELFNITCV